MTDYTTKTLAELRRDWCERVGTVHENIGWASVGGVDFPLRLRKGWALAGLVLDEMARRGWTSTAKARLSTDGNPECMAMFWKRTVWGMTSAIDPAIDRAALIAAHKALDAEEESNGG